MPVAPLPPLIPLPPLLLALPRNLGHGEFARPMPPLSWLEGVVVAAVCAALPDSFSITRIDVEPDFTPVSVARSPRGARKEMVGSSLVQVQLVPAVRTRLPWASSADAES